VAGATSADNGDLEFAWHPMKRGRPGGFTLVELIVVMGIVAILFALLLPCVAKVQSHSRWIHCQSNLRQIGVMLAIYEQQNGGRLYPPTGGMERPPHERWPVFVFKMRAPNPPPYDATMAAIYVAVPYQPEIYPAGPYTPQVMRCPSDVDPFEAHSYVLNGHLRERSIKAGSGNLGGLTSSDVILAGEKATGERDYFVERGDFERVVAPYRHGIRGSNYLYLDKHVGMALPPAALAGLDRWDIRPF
jgi:prepilin-type N-terminal cleavage/methylation domain-containing protein